MIKHLSVIICLLAVLCCLCSCEGDTPGIGQGVLDENDAILVMADTFTIKSAIDSCDAIISQADSFLLGEMETDYGLIRASILTQLACPEGYSYPEGAEVDSICLFMYYSTWMGAGNSPLAINAYLMDKKTFSYSGVYPTDICVEDYCSRDNSILQNHRIIAASEKLDSAANSSGKYVPMVRMKLTDEFMRSFWQIQQFKDQDSFNEQFKGLLIETSFGSSTVLNVTDIALGVYYHFTYSKAGRDTTVNDIKAFYANAEVRTVNHLVYQGKAQWIEQMQRDSATYNYVVSPAGVYTRLTFPMEQIATMIEMTLSDTLEDGTVVQKRPYVNKAQVQVDVENVFDGASADKNRNDWLQPTDYMLLIREESMRRFFEKKELPSDTCALLGALTQGVDSAGNTIYYYSYDLSDFLHNQLRPDSLSEELKMMLVPVTVTTGTTNSATTTISSVKQKQTLSATKIKSAQNGMNLKLVYSGF